MLVIDANTGRVLHQSAADEPRHPASLAKMMTLYLAFELIEQGRLSYQTKIKISANAAAAAPSKLDLEEGEEIALIDAIKALITKSANDVAIAVAEHIAGSEEKFARLMTQKARQLGMTATIFRNASGLPDDEQVTTARDMVTLALQPAGRFPQALPAVRHAHLHLQRTRRFRNHNTLLVHYEGTDGIKTGYTRASGFNLVASVRRGRKHVIGAVFGGASAASRNAAMRTFLNMGLVKASTEKTRQPVPLLVGAGAARAGAQGRAGADAAARRAPRPRRSNRSGRPATRGRPAAAPAGARAAALAGHRDRARALRPRVRRAPPIRPRTAAAARLDGTRLRGRAGAGGPAGPEPVNAAADEPIAHAGVGRQPRAGSQPMHVAAAAPMERPALSSGAALGARRAALDAGAAGRQPGARRAAGRSPAVDRCSEPRSASAGGPRAQTRADDRGARRRAPRGAFHIQIGAYQSQAEAEKRLASARELAPGAARPTALP